MSTNPILVLESYVNQDCKFQDDYVKKQIGFCAQWLLDNLCKNISIFIILIIHMRSWREKPDKLFYIVLRKTHLKFANYYNSYFRFFFQALI